MVVVRFIAIEQSSVLFTLAAPNKKSEEYFKN